MRISISLVKSNPFRDFALDPIDDDQVVRLAASHDQVGQFGAIPVRPSQTDPGYYEQASGHHNVAAMRLRGDTEVNVEIRERSDDEMAKLLALENLTQRTSNAGAIADAVAARIKLEAPAALTLLNDSIQQRSGNAKSGTARARQQLLEDGPGYPLLYERINGFPVADAKQVKNGGGKEILSLVKLRAALASLKATGYVARIMADAYAEVQAELERVRKAEVEAERQRQIREAEQAEEAKRKAAEAEEAKRRAAEARRRADEAKEKGDREAKRKAAEEAERRAEAAQVEATRKAALQRQREKDATERRAAQEAKAKAEKERAQKEAAKLTQKISLPSSYDPRCVSVFETPEQESAFRSGVLSDNGLRFIAFDQQHPLAKSIRAKIDSIQKKRGHTVGSTTVRDLVNEVLREAILKQSEYDKSAEAARRLVEADEERIKRLWDTARRGLQQALSALEKLGAEEKAWTYAHPFPIDPKFTSQMRDVSKRVDSVIKQTTGI